MAITKAKKVEIVAKVAAGLKEAETVAFVNFHGLTVRETTTLRKKLREEGVSYYVAKKSLIGRALDAHGITGEKPEFPGELAIVWAKDAVLAPKEIAEFAKTRKDKMTLVGGIYQGAYMSKEDITALAAIPSMQGLRGMFVGLLSNSIGGVVRVIDAKAKQMEAVPAA